jgi:hypothetical protein
MVVNLVSNLTQTTDSGFSINNNQWLSSSFTTGSGSYGYTINSVTLRLAKMTANPNFLVRLYNDSLSSQIASFTNPSFTLNITNDYIFTITTPQILTANTTYWLVAGISGGSGQDFWAFTTSPNQTGLPGWSIGNNSFYSDNQGGTWDNNFSVTFSAFQFSVNGQDHSL